MTKIFLSYSRSDALTAGLIYRHLSAHFGTDEIFRDVESISGGDDFRKVIDDAVNQSDAVVVVIGKHWLEGMSPDESYLFREVEMALRRGKIIIPVLINGASMPEAKDLPYAIREIAFRDPVKVRSDVDFREDITRLIYALEANTKALREPAIFPRAATHQRVAMPLHILIVCILGVLALASVGGGIYAIAVRSAAHTTLNIFGAELSTEHVGVALVGIGLIITLLVIRAVLKNQLDLGRLPPDNR